MSRKPSFNSNLPTTARLNYSQKIYPGSILTKKPSTDFDKYSSQVQDRNASQQTHYTINNYPSIRKLPDSITSIRETFSYNTVTSPKRYEVQNVQKQVRQRTMKINDGLRCTLDVRLTKKNQQRQLERSVSSYLSPNLGLYIKSDGYLQSADYSQRYRKQSESRNEIKSYPNIPKNYQNDIPIQQQIRRLRQQPFPRPATLKTSQSQTILKQQSQQKYNINIKSHQNFNEKHRNQNFSKKNYIEYYTPKIEKTQQNDRLISENSNVLSPQYSRVKKETSFDVPVNSPKKVTDIKQIKDTIENKTVNRGKTKSLGLSIDNFIIGKSLGQGRFGTAHMAVDKATGAIFALKKVKKQVIKSNKLIDQFILEVKLQSHLVHPFIVKIYGIFDDLEHIYIILEFMQQGTLFNYLKKFKKLQQQDAAEKIRYLAESIKYLQDRGIAHRDIKPQNILLSNGVCKLADFGWATFCDEQRRKTYCGTCDYVAPQILQGHEYDETVDLWCIGILTYELMTGKAPFYHMSAKETKKKIINVSITYPEDFGEHLKSFIGGLIQKDPEQRMSIEEVLVHSFIKSIKLSQ